MITNEVLVSSKPNITRLLIYLLLIVVVGVGNVKSQETRTVKKRAGSSVLLSTYKEIPGPTEPCTPSECEWWEQLRQAGNDLQLKGDKKSKKKYILLFVEGIEKNHRIPLGDRPSQILVPTIPVQYSRDLVPKNGKVELSIEVRPDGSVGEVKVVKGLRSDMDQRCIQAQRKNIYLPSVKDQSFVTEWQKTECSFWSRKGI